MMTRLRTKRNRQTMMELRMRIRQQTRRKSMTRKAQKRLRKERWRTRTASDDTGQARLVHRQSQAQLPRPSS
ncbi:hypothetical protein B0T14DRAFT_522377 [Immersiella caudata]|uniref:Uncharacterized protein n=1 Tax=Immersiella caudata TaxID=314043 RepID=A0AA40C0L1_9PEZI|nr:hypothetical protein B0T14DRAFT_522377 [Immersiella caudata]